MDKYEIERAKAIKIFEEGIKYMEDLKASLTRMYNLYVTMMDKIDHKHAWYDADCLREMNEAPVEAKRLIDR